MNKPVALLTFALLLSQISIAQDFPKNLDVSWTNLKADIKRKTDVTIFIADSLVKLNQVNQKEVKQVKTIALQLFWHVDTAGILNRFSVSVVYSLHVSLSKALSRLRTTLEQKDKLKNSRQFFDLLIPLDGIDNRLYTTQMDFNDACGNANRPDLYFGNYRKHQTVGLDTSVKRTYNNHFMTDH